MSRPDKYKIHSDFAGFPVITIRFNRLVIGFFNFMLRMTRLWRKHRADIAFQRHRTNSADGFPVKLIVMRPHQLKECAPALVYYHGGAFAMTYSSLHLKNAETYANEAACITIFVQYRLGPKHPFPKGFQDCYAALKWTLANANKLGIDPRRIAVGGDSAGGALAAGVAQKARDEELLELCGQMLIYPVLDHSCSTFSATEYVDVPLFHAGSNRAMWKMYLSQYVALENPPYAAPGHGDLNNLPPTYIETAEYDPLRDEALAFAEALRSAGNAPVLNTTLGTIHGYDGNANSELAKQSMKKRIHFLNQVMNLS